MQGAGVVIRGAVLTSLGYGSVQAMRLVSNLLLARWLAPEAFGLLAIANAVQIGLQMLSDLGIGPSIIRHERGREPRFLDTMWTLQILRGLLLALAAAAASLPLAALYEAPMLSDLLIIIVLGGLAASFASTSVFTMPREQRLGRLTLLEIFSQTVAYATMLGIAWHTRSVWSLAVGGLIHGLLRCLLSHLLLPGHRHRLAWDQDALRDVLGFGRWIVLSTLVTFLAGQSDRLTLGLLAPLATVGVYAIAASLAFLPREVAGRLADGVLLPYLSRLVRNDAGDLAPGLDRIRSLFLPIGLLLSSALAVGSPWFFDSLYDERYGGASELAPWLVVLGWIGAVQVPLQRALLALGHSRPLAAANLARWVTGLVGSLSAFAFLGESGFVGGLCIGAVAGAVVLHRSASRLGLVVWRQDAAYLIALVVIVATSVAARSGPGPILGLGLPEIAPVAISLVLLTMTVIWAAGRVVRIAR